MSLRWEVSWPRKVYGISTEKMLQDRGALLKEGSDVIREHKAMHEENFLSSWLREDVEGKEEGKKKVDRETKEEGEKKEGKRRGTQERTKRRLSKEGISTLSPLRALKFSARRDSESFGNSWGDLLGDLWFV